MPTHEISPQKLTLEQLAWILDSDSKLALSPDAKESIERNRTYLDRKVASSDTPIYGINTGFGSLYNVSIDKQDLQKLQTNLIMSHATGMGDEVPRDIVRLILLLKIQSLSYGHSAIALETIMRLIEMYNVDALPVIYKQGSLGASGDLAPLAHLSLPLIGLGYVRYRDRLISGEEFLKIMNWQPLQLKSKEGLALLNGTQFMLGYAAWIGIQTINIMKQADRIAALSLDGFDGRIEPFDPLIHQLRPHSGQIATAQYFRQMLEGSQIATQPKVHVQDPYSFRCIPQVHGASKDAFEYFRQVIEIEINSVTDNPNVFEIEDKVISGGNFHGQPLALALDFLSIALAELGNISERRTYLLLSGTRGLPLYLVANPGINSGFMIAQYTAAAIVSQNKQYANPASTDSIVSSNGQEDHVSMGANAATKCFDIVRNLQSILTIEAICAAQAIDFRAPLKSSPSLMELHHSIRSIAKFMEHDQVMYHTINNLKNHLFKPSE